MLLSGCLSLTITAIGVGTFHIVQQAGAVKMAPSSPPVHHSPQHGGSTAVLCDLVLVRPSLLLSAPVQPDTTISSVPTIGERCTTPASILCQDMSEHARLDSVSGLQRANRCSPHAPNRRSPLSQDPCKRLVDHVRRAAHFEVSSSRRLVCGCAGGYGSLSLPWLINSPAHRPLCENFHMFIRESRSCRALLVELTGQVWRESICMPITLHPYGKWERMHQQPHANPNRAIFAICNR
jgi:hypothetical protein